MTAELELSVGEESEDLLQFILDQFDDATLDALEVRRTQARAHGAANEPVTVAFLIATLSPPIIGSITTLVGKWLDNRAKDRRLKLTLAVRGVPPEAAPAVAELAARVDVEPPAESD